jgi:hypothetical protein
MSTPLHRDLLLTLRTAQPYGVPVAKLLSDLRALGHRSLTQPALEAAVRELADRSLAALVEGLLGQSWRITALGVSTLQEAGL